MIDIQPASVDSEESFLEWVNETFFRTADSLDLMVVEELGFDSIEIYELACAIEEWATAELVPQAMESLFTLRDVYEFVLRNRGLK